MHGPIAFLGLLLILVGFFLPIPAIGGVQLPANVALVILGLIFLVPTLARKKW